VTPTWQDGDELFARLTQITEGLEDERLDRFLARLVFLLADRVGNAESVCAAVEEAAKEVAEARPYVRAAKRLAGRVALVTGAGSSEAGVGIGDAIARLFAHEGAAVWVADVDAERAERTRALVGDAGGHAEVIVADMTVAGECRRAVAAVREEHGGLDVLVNNVGTTARVSFDKLTEEEWDRVMSVNAKSVAFMTAAAAPLMNQRQGAQAEAHTGAVVNIASIGGLVASGGGLYGASKAAVVMLTRDLAVAYGRRGIRVNAIAPGHLHTPFVGDLSPNLRRDRARIAPLGIEGDAWDVARAALFLAGDEARMITGVCLPVDAGVTVVSPLRAHRYLEAADRSDDIA
jgi:NAD(P)-dependent dehydrogenase (short-subunit alcohol dehydrogenase family)